MLGDTLLPVHVLELSAKLTVNDCAVTDDYNRIYVRGVDKPLGKPGNCLGLAAAGTVPDQIPTAYALFKHILFAAQHSAKLVEAREYHVAFIVYKHKFADDAQQHIALEDVFPNVMGTVLSGNNRVTGTFVLAAAVIGQETDFFFIQTSGNKSYHFIKSEVDKSSSVKGEDKLIGIAGRAKLLCTLKSGLLPGGLLLELDHGNRNAVKEYGQVHTVRLRLVLKAELSADREDIFLILCLIFGHGRKPRLEESEAEFCSTGIVLHPLIE